MDDKDYGFEDQWDQPRTAAIPIYIVVLLALPMPLHKF